MSSFRIDGAVLKKALAEATALVLKLAKEKRPWPSRSLRQWLAPTLLPKGGATKVQAGGN